MTGDTTSHVAEIAIEVPPHVVFQYFVEPAKLMRWMGEKADLDPRPGGVFAVDIQGLLVRGQYTAVEPPRRLVFTWGSPDNPALPAGSTSVEVILEAEVGATARSAHCRIPYGVGPNSPRCGRSFSAATMSASACSTAWLASSGSARSPG
jgi:uncharacterized protein YndB with AHSA1/START domain